jgi:polyisoprenoid-binding protein YceI
MLIFISACARVTRPTALPAPSGAPAYPSDLRGAKLYRLSSADSSLHILVYRGGTLASLGHNHVMSSKSVAGFVWLHSNLQASGFDLAMPVNDLIVDDNAARQAEGADFPPNVPDDAKAGTQRNMLSEAVLDGAHYPRVTLRSISVSGSKDNPVIRASIAVKGQAREVSVPVKLSEQGRQLKVSGEFEIKQSDFGIKPFSVALGALQVQDTLRVKFELVALPAS